MTPAQKVAIKLIETYQRRGGGKELLRVECNFHPTCSAYSRQAIEKFGIFKGTRIALRRISKCNQPDLVTVLHDPVPKKQGTSHV